MIKAFLLLSLIIGGGMCIVKICQQDQVSSIPEPRSWEETRWVWDKEGGK